MNRKGINAVAVVAIFAMLSLAIIMPGAADAVLIDGGDFESEGSWHVYDEFDSVVNIQATDGPYNGTRYAKIEGIMHNVMDPCAFCMKYGSISTSVKIPVDATFLQYHLKYYLSDVDSSFRVFIDNTEVENISSSEYPLSLEWTEKKLNITAYRGQTVNLQFAMTNPIPDIHSNQIYVGIDDVKIETEEKKYIPKKDDAVIGDWIYCGNDECSNYTMRMVIDGKGIKISGAMPNVEFYYLKKDENGWHATDEAGSSVDMDISFENNIWRITSNSVVYIFGENNSVLYSEGKAFHWHISKAEYSNGGWTKYEYLKWIYNGKETLSSDTIEVKLSTTDELLNFLIPGLHMTYLEFAISTLPDINYIFIDDYEGKVIKGEIDELMKEYADNFAAKFPVRDVELVKLTKIPLEKSIKKNVIFNEEYDNEIKALFAEFNVATGSQRTEIANRILKKMEENELVIPGNVKGIKYIDTDMSSRVAFSGAMGQLSVKTSDSATFWLNANEVGAGEVIVYVDYINFGSLDALRGALVRAFQNAADLNQPVGMSFDLFMQRGYRAETRFYIELAEKGVEGAGTKAAWSFLRAQDWHAMVGSWLEMTFGIESQEAKALAEATSEKMANLLIRLSKLVAEK